MLRGQSRLHEHAQAWAGKATRLTLSGLTSHQVMQLIGQLGCCRKPAHACAWERSLSPGRAPTLGRPSLSPGEKIRQGRQPFACSFGATLLPTARTRLCPPAPRNPVADTPSHTPRRSHGVAVWPDLAPTTILVVAAG